MNGEVKGGRRIIDISRLLSPRTAPWPGDERLSMEWTLAIAHGDPVDLSVVRLSPHVGTHADAPRHVREGAAGADHLPLEQYIGPARVVTVGTTDKNMVDLNSLRHIDLADPPRLLLRTGSDPDPEKFPEPYTAIGEAAAKLLAEGGAVLVGIDTPSVDLVDSKDLPAHNVLLDGGVVWLENLDLRSAPDGVYELVALPLRIEGGDAAPVRAVLIDRQTT